LCCILYIYYIALCTATVAEESESDGDEVSMNKYRQLLLGEGGNSKVDENEDSDGFVDLEVTWDTGMYYNEM